MADENASTYLTNSGQSLTDILQQLKDANLYQQPDYTSVINPELYSAQQLSDLLGVNFTYDREEIEKIYQDATKSAMETESNSGAERSYYANLANAQNTALDTIRQQYNSAVASGANKGMQAANMLSTILGTTQTANEEATQLAVDKQKLANTYATQLKEDTANALQYSNEMGNTLGSLAHQYYNDQIQQLTAQLGYNQAINTDAAGVAANQYTAGTGVYNNNQAAIAQLQAAIESAKATKYAAEKAQTQNINYSGGYSVSS